MSPRTCKAGTIARAVAALGLVALVAACAESRSERAFERIVAQEKTRETNAVRADLRQLIEKWPNTPAAERARKEIEWLNDLDQSSTRGEGLLAWDAVRRVGMAVEKYRIAQRRYPERYDDLVPRYLPGPIRDPWGQPVGYLRTPRGYQVISYGSDGIPGGSGDAVDILVENGREIRQGGSPTH